jgi:hypothetical protein
MIFRAKPPIRRTSKGVELALSPDERHLLRVLIADHRQQLDADSTEEELQRLFPTAYHDAPARDAEYQILARSELLDARLEVLRTVEATIEHTLLDDEQLGAWMAAVNQLRLVLGTRLDIGEDDPDEIDPDDPEAAERLLYHYLTHLLHLLVEASGY